MNVFELVAGISLDTKEYESQLRGAEKSTEDAGQKMDDAGGKAEGFGGKLSKVGGVALKVGAALATAVGGAMVAVGKQALDTYADFEQLEGGAKLMFGEGFQTVAENAKNAWKDVQMSQNEYLTEANKYAVGLKSALDNDGQAAAELAHGIIKAQADVVAATGNSAESVQNAFNGVMKGNYTMLDNLGLGITATKEGFQEVIDKVNEANGTDYHMDNVAEAQQALIDYVEMCDMAGYAAAEGATTMQGSIKSMQSAWENFVGALANPEADLGEAMDALLESFTVVVEKFLPLITEMVPKIAEAFTTLAPMLVDAIVNLLPVLIPAIIDVVTNLANAIVENAPLMVQALTDGLLQLVDAILPILPQLLEAAVQIVVTIVDAITQNTDTLIPAMVECILVLIQALLDNLPLLINAAVKLVVAVVEGIMKSLPKIIEAGGQLLKAVIDGIKRGILKIDKVGLDIAKGLVNGIMGAIGWVKEKITGFGKKVVGFFKGAFDIHSPSRVMRDQVGKMIGLGIVEGLEESTGEIEDAVWATGNAMDYAFKGAFEGTRDNIDDMLASMSDSLKNFSQDASVETVDALYTRAMDTLSDAYGKIEDLGTEASLVQKQRLDDLFTYMESLDRNVLDEYEMMKELTNIMDRTVKESKKATKENLKNGIHTLLTFGVGYGVTKSDDDLAEMRKEINKFGNGINYAFENEFKGTNEEVANLFNGVVSTIRDLWDKGLGLDDEEAVFDSTMELLVDGMSTLEDAGTEAAQGLAKQFEALIKLAEQMDRKTNSTGDILKNLTDNMESAAKQLESNLSFEEVMRKNGYSEDWIQRQLNTPVVKPQQPQVVQNITVQREVQSASEMARAIRLESRYGLMTGVAFG